MTTSIPQVPWQVTGNHWITLPCIHPADAAIHCIGGLHARHRAAVEFAGGPAFLGGSASPLVRITIEVDGERVALAGGGIAWERESGWLPGFTARVGDLTLRGTICAPHGRKEDISGVVIGIGVENRGDAAVEIRLGLEGTLGHRQLRVRAAREFADAHRVTAASGGAIVLEGEGAESPMAVAIAGEGNFDVGIMQSAASWTLGRTLAVAGGETQPSWFHIAVGAERDGALGMLRSMLRRGGADLIEMTRTALRKMAPATGNPAADRLVARHAFFCYFGSVGRALDESHWYIVRSRLPWSEGGMTIRDWHALMWILPAVQLLDATLAREVLLRICELHGYAPGGGVHYLDGSVFEPGFSLEGAAAYAIGVDGYIVETSDDKIVEEAVIAECLYGSQEDIEERKHVELPLYSTEVNPDGTTPEYPYTAHGNAVVALALDILRHTLDEKTSEKLQDPAAVRASLLRKLSESGNARATLSCSADLAGNASMLDNPSASVYWLPYFDLVQRDDSIYRRTVKRIESGKIESLEVRVAQLLGPSGNDALDWLRRAPLDGGFAAEHVDAEGRATFNGGDAAMSGLIAHTLWYAVHALGVGG